MSNDNTNVVAGQPLTTGGILLAPKGTVLPTDAAAAPGAAFKSAGYVGDSGVTESGDRGTKKIKAWGGDTVKIIQTDYSLTYKFTFLEALNGEVLKAVHGATNVTTTAATVSTGTLQAIKLNSDVLPHQAFIFEIKDGLARIRICLPDGQITEVGGIKYADDDVVAYDVTVEAFKDSTLGANALKYLDNGIFSA